MKNHNVYLGLGSNLGNRKMFIQSAIKQLATHPLVNVITAASLINNTAISTYPQPDYLNTACHIKTTLTPNQLWELTLIIEKKIGRSSKGEGKSRNIDIDILLYSDHIINTPKLTIPHPRMHQRNFVLTPLNEIAPHIKHPIFKITVNKLYEELKVSA
mgnify:FL=1